MSTHIESRKLTTREAAVAMNVSQQQVYRLRKQGIGPKFMKIGKKVFYEAEVVERWLEEAQRTKTVPEPPRRQPRRSLDAAA